MIYISYPLHICTPKIIADYPKQMITQTNTNMSGVTTEEPGNRKFTEKRYNTDTVKIVGVQDTVKLNLEPLWPHVPVLLNKQKFKLKIQANKRAKPRPNPPTN
ncbi:hypothetical protein BDB01DRAFT_840265 [Pilobolus umbonatus]|nr:hypothetical protein BDB01DRAFT_840265 [Pilobolus umbonatus]